MGKARLLIFVCSALIMGLALSSKALCAEDQFAQELKLSRTVMQAERKLTILKAMQLSDQEAQKFWPLYDKYRSAVAKVNNGIIELINDYFENYRSISDEKAGEMIEKFLAIEKSIAELKLKYLEKFAKVLPGKKVARFFQLDNKLDSITDFNLAAHVPLIGEADVLEELSQ